MTTVLASIFLILGGFFGFVASLGVLRFPDFYSRIHAATKASTFGIGFSGLAAAIAFGSVSAWIKMSATIAFLFVTLPVAAHLLGRAYKAREEDRSSP